MNTPVDRTISLAVANGVTPRTAASWAVFLPRSPRVLVPIHVEALMVRQPGGQWANCAMTLPAQAPDSTVEVSTLMPPPFQALDPAKRPRGAYLHWALPDALTAGSQDSSGTTFPAIPDRWVVIRIYPSPTHADRRTIKGWVLQAGDAQPVPLDLDTWTEPGKPPAGIKKPLTVMGHGDVAWSAYYDNVVNRLGFYDNLQDNGKDIVGPVAYLVCGWYSDPSLDPLRDPGIHSLADFDAKMQAMKWSLADKDFHEAAAKSVKYVVAAGKAGLNTRLSPAAQARATVAFDARPFSKPEPGSTPAGPPYVTDGAWWPQDSLYHGSVLGIGWPGIGWPDNPDGTLSKEEGGPPAAGKVTVAVGNTLGEALAALVTNAKGSADDGRILEAFQQGMLSELDEPDGRTRLDTALHASAFGSLPGGSTTERVWQPPSGQPPTGPANPPTPGSGVFGRYESGKKVRAASINTKPSLSAMKPGQVQAHMFQATSYLQETQVAAGGMAEMMGLVAPAFLDPYVPGKWVDAQRSLPRYYRPADPVVLLQGLSRSFQFGNDGRFSPDGTLQCRLTGTCVHEFYKITGDIVWPPLHPNDVLDRGVENGSLPPECDELLGEAAVLDPGASVTLVNAGTKTQKLTPAQRSTQIQNVMVEQTAWWSARDPRVDHSPMIARTSFTGMLPSPVSIGLPSNPWSPVHLEWSVEFTPSPGGLADWNLGENDYTESVPKLPPAGAPVISLKGRSPLHDGASLTAAKAVRKAIDQIRAAGTAGPIQPNTHEQAASVLSQTLLLSLSQLAFNPNSVPDAEKAQLEDIATTLESIDVLSTSLSNFHLRLRGGYLGDGVTAPGPSDPAPSPFFPMRAGFLRILQLRLVDCFGQFIDLAGSSAVDPANLKPVDPKKLIRTEPLDVPARPELLALPPRFTSPSRIWLRYMDAGGSAAEAGLATDVTPQGVSPVCGYVMPQHLDRALEFFGADGSNLGVLRPADDGSILWEDAPGLPSTVGQSPSRAIPNQFLGALGEGLLQWGVADAGLPAEKDTALQALLRVIDSTLWAVDPFGHQGDEHLALLVGHPVAVLRAIFRIELNEAINPAAANQIQVPVRLGALAQWQDGVLGYFVNDDYKTLYCCDAAAAGLATAIGPGQGFLQQVNQVQGYYDSFGPQSATPVQHPYINTSGTFWVYPNQDVRLTLLVEPFCGVHATSGIQPRKEVGMRREWVTGGLAKIAPTFRFGPVLIDPLRVRMPIAAELNGNWSWDHRTDVTTWADDPVTHATQDALLPDDPPVGSEGWLKLSPPDQGAKK